MANAISALASSAMFLPLPRTGSEAAAPTPPAVPPPLPRALVLPSFPAPLAQAVLELLPAVKSLAPRTETSFSPAQAAQPHAAAITATAEAAVFARVGTDSVPERSLPPVFPQPTPLPPAGADDAQRAWAALSSGLLTPTLLRHAHGFGGHATAARDPDTVLIQAVQEAASFIGCRLDVSAEFEQITPADMFSIAEDAGSPLAALSERFIPAILGDLITQDERIMLAMATTRASFIPTARIALRLPYISGAAQIEAATHGHRRLYDSAARDRNPFTQRPCSIALSGSVVVSGIQISAPILVDGRHWGCLRLAYRSN